MTCLSRHCLKEKLGSMKKLLALCLTGLLILPMASACAAAGAATTSLVPGTANAVVQIQVARILANPALLVAYGELARTRPEWPQTAEAALGQVAEKTGFDLAGISTAVIFAHIESANHTGSTYAGIIATAVNGVGGVSGSFDEPAIVARIARQTRQTLTTSDHKGITIYAGGQDNVEMAFLGSGRLVLGTARAVRDTIDVSKGDQKPLSGRLVETLDRLGPALITGAIAPTAGLRDGLAGKMPARLPLSLTTFQDIDTVGFSLDLPALTLNVGLEAHFSNTTSIQDARDAVTGLISMARATAQDPNLKTTLGNIKITAVDSWLSLRGVAGMAEIATLIGSMQTQK
jgi:hypothetical protein